MTSIVCNVTAPKAYETPDQPSC